MERIHYLEPFNNIAGDKMAKEPRLAAFAIANDIEKATLILQSKFSEQEWNYYQKANAQSSLQNTSAGRYFDAVASLLDLVNINSYEGEAALLLEQHASDFLREKKFDSSEYYFEEEINQPMIPMKNVITKIINDIDEGKSNSEIAARFHSTLTHIIERVAETSGVKHIAFSGGVFQNAVLLDSVTLRLGKKFQLYFHEQMPANDECIAFGQLMHFQNVKS